MLEVRGKNHTGDIMLIPIRCFSCNKVIAGSYEEYVSRRDSGEDPAEVMDDLGIERYCCRRVFLAHKDVIDELMPYD